MISSKSILLVANLIGYVVATGPTRPSPRSRPLLDAKAVVATGPTYPAPRSRSLLDAKFNLGLRVGAQIFRVHLDTGSSVTWILNKNASVSGGMRYDPSLSTFHKPHGEAVTKSYLTGEVKGFYSRDRISIGDSRIGAASELTIRDGLFVEVTDMPGEIPNTKGLLGMPLMPFSTYGWESFMTQLVFNAKISRWVFGVCMGSYKDLPDTRKNRGELMIGGVDLKMATSPISFYKVFTNPDSTQESWDAEIGEEVQVNGRKLSTSVSKLRPVATFDTGTRSIWGPKSIIEAMMGELGARIYRDPDGIEVYIANCDSIRNKPISFSMPAGIAKDGKKGSPLDIVIRPEDYVGEVWDDDTTGHASPWLKGVGLSNPRSRGKVCLLKFIRRKKPDEVPKGSWEAHYTDQGFDVANSWLFGEPFFTNRLVIFDQGREPKIGIAIADRGCGVDDFGTANSRPKANYPIRRRGEAAASSDNTPPSSGSVVASPVAFHQLIAAVAPIAAISMF